MFKELFIETAKGSSIKDLQKVIKKDGQVMVITGSKDLMVVIDSIEDGTAYGLDQFDKDVEIDLNKEKVTISEDRMSVSKATHINSKKFNIIYVLDGNESDIEVYDKDKEKTVVDLMDVPEKEVQKILKKYKGK